MEFFNKWAPIFMERLQKDFKISLLSSAAIVGNAGHESGGFKSLQEKKPLVPGSRGGYGIMQWTGPRRREYEAYCKRNGKDPADMESNYSFLFVELKGSEGKDGKVLQRVEAAKTLDLKTEVFMKEFLRPGIPHLAERKKWALRALQAWDKAPVVSNPPKEPEASVDPLPEAKKSIWELILEILWKLLK